VTRGLRWALFSLVLLLFILAPFVFFEGLLESWSRRLLSGASNPGVVASVVVGLLALDVVLPIPSSFVAAFAVSLLGVVGGGLTVFVGLSAAAWVGYALGRVGGTPLASKIAGDHELVRARSMMDRYGVWVLVLCRGIPVLAETSTLFAGVVRQTPFAFGVVTTLGNLGVAAAYAAAGLFSLPGGLELLLPFVFGLLVPGLSWLSVRALLARRASP
jgi:uncharacterized membrane protein YdjX (TVP38/TMEM64 family)